MIKLKLVMMSWLFCEVKELDLKHVNDKNTLHRTWNPSLNLRTPKCSVGKQITIYSFFVHMCSGLSITLQMFFYLSSGKKKK